MDRRDECRNALGVTRTEMNSRDYDGCGDDTEFAELPQRHHQDLLAPEPPSANVAETVRVPDAGALPSR